MPPLPHPSRSVARLSARTPGWLRLAMAFTLGACGSDAVVSANGVPNRTLFASVGQEVHLTLQTIGPGEYESPPTISTASLRFLDVTFVSPSVPAGPTQRFRFTAEAPGQAVIVFHHTGQNAAVEDTVLVR